MQPKTIRLADCTLFRLSRNNIIFVIKAITHCRILLDSYLMTHKIEIWDIFEIFWDILWAIIEIWIKER